MQDIGYKLYALVLAVAIVLGNMAVFGYWWGFVGAATTTFAYLFVADHVVAQWARK